MNAPTTIKKPSVLATMADRFGLDTDKMLTTLKGTVIKGNCSNEQVAAFVVVANQYNLNPFTKEIYAFPDKVGGITPVVSIDGWSRIINDHPSFDGMAFMDQRENGQLVAITCRMYRKDRAHPIEATEYMAECKRPGEVWTKWPSRMLRHKAMIQAARYAFGFSGIVDPDEYDRGVRPQVRVAEAYAAEQSEQAGTIEIIDGDGVIVEQVDVADIAPKTSAFTDDEIDAKLAADDDFPGDQFTGAK